MGKNLQRVQDMLDGNYKSKTQVGYGDQESKHRSVGDKWTDSEGYEWEQKEGFKVKSAGSMPAVGMFNHQCKDCQKNCSSKSYDRDTWNRMNRCYNCQTKFEEDLKWNPENKIGEKANKWMFWVRLQELNRWIDGRKELEQWIDEQDKIRKEPLYSGKVANAMANANVEMTINKNKA